MVFWKLCSVHDEHVHVFRLMFLALNCVLRRSSIELRCVLVVLAAFLLHYC